MAISHQHFGLDGANSGQAKQLQALLQQWVLHVHPHKGHDDLW